MSGLYGPYQSETAAMEKYLQLKQEGYRVILERRRDRLSKGNVHKYYVRIFE